MLPVLPVIGTLMGVTWCIAGARPRSAAGVATGNLRGQPPGASGRGVGLAAKMQGQQQGFAGRSARVWQTLLVALGVATARRDRVELIWEDGMRRAVKRTRATRGLQQPAAGSGPRPDPAALLAAATALVNSAAGALAAAAGDAVGAVGGAMQSLAAAVQGIGQGHAAPAARAQQPVAAVQGVVTESAPALARRYLKPGCVWQNPRMSLWNDSNVPVSAVLRVSPGDLFELDVRNLDSKDAGSEGRIVFQGSVTLEPVKEAPSRMRIVLQSDNPSEAFSYDDRLFNRGAAFALSCMKRFGAAVLSAFKLEVDMESDIVYVEPRNSVLRGFWKEPVGLRPAREGSLWVHSAAQDGRSAPVPAGFPAEAHGVLAMA